VCLDSLLESFGFSVGRYFVDKAFGGESKAYAEEVIHAVIAAFQDRLPGRTWLDDETRAKAREKVEAIRVKVRLLSLAPSSSRAKIDPRILARARTHPDRLPDVAQHDRPVGARALLRAQPARRRGRLFRQRAALGRRRRAPQVGLGREAKGPRRVGNGPERGQRLLPCVCRAAVRRPEAVRARELTRWGARLAEPSDNEIVFPAGILQTVRSTLPHGTTRGSMLTRNAPVQPFFSVDW